MIFFRVSIRLGEWNTDTEEDCLSGSRVRVCSDKPLDVDVEKTIVHSGYSMTDRNRRNDIALVKLRRPVTYTSKSNVP